MTSIHAGLNICDPEDVYFIENDFINELIQTNYKNMSFGNHLEHFLNLNWTEENSFCMDGEPKVGLTEVYIAQPGICFVLNSKENIFSQR